MKKIEDYLHLYHGSEAIVEKSNYHMVHNWLVHTGDKIVIDGKVSFHMNNINPKPIIKPILRKLDSMTEEEAKHIVNETNLKQVTMGRTEKEFAIALAERWVANSHILHYLLYKHFDLFGLIDAGLALDATKTESTRV